MHLCSTIELHRITQAEKSLQNYNPDLSIRFCQLKKKKKKITVQSFIEEHGVVSILVF